MQLVLVAHTRPTVLTRNSPQKQHKRERKPPWAIQKLFEGHQSQQHILQSNWIEFWGKSTPKPNQKAPSVYPSNSKAQILLYSLVSEQRKLRRGTKGSQQLGHCAGLQVPALSWAVCVLSQQLPLLPKFTLGALCFSNHKYTTCWTCCCVEGESTGRRD